MGTSTSPRIDGLKSKIDQAGIRAVLGIRYAQLSNGERFSAPVAADGQLEVQRLAEVPVFPQLPSRLASVMGTGRDNPQAEDSFFLNVWAPEGAVGLPVLVFVHGGAWTSGGGSNEWYDGSALSAENMVVVTVNYRIGPLAHLAAPGALDLPLQDLALALQWVSENIGAFGGDPDEVTLAGQSAGAWYVHLLSMDPGAKGLMRRVALLSMATREPWSRERLEAVRDAATKRMHPRSLENAEVEDLLKAGVGALQETAERRPLGHAPSGYLPGRAENIPEDFLRTDWCARNVHVNDVLLSFTAQETGTFFCEASEERSVSHEAVDAWVATLDEVDLPPDMDLRCRAREPYDRIVHISSWVQFQRFPTELHNAYSERGLNSHLVRLEMRSLQPGVLSGHCLDLPYWFGTLDTWADAPMLQGVDPEEFAIESLRLRRLLARFVQGHRSA